MTSSAALRLLSKPGRPVAKCDRGIYVTVEWTWPKAVDEAADITGYVIKYFARSHIYQVIGDFGEVHVDGIETSFQFTHQLKQRTSYQFAVAARNRVGRGAFSEFSHSVTTLFGKYPSMEANCYWQKASYKTWTEVINN